MNEEKDIDCMAFIQDRFDAFWKKLPWFVRLAAPRNLIMASFIAGATEGVNFTHLLSQEMDWAKDVRTLRARSGQ